MGHKDAHNCRNRRCTVVASGMWWTPKHALLRVSRPLVASGDVRRLVVGVLPEWLQFELGGCAVAVGCFFTLWSHCAWQLPFRRIGFVVCAPACTSECAFRRLIRLLRMVWMLRLTPLWTRERVRPPVMGYIHPADLVGDTVSAPLEKK